MTNSYDLKPGQVWIDRNDTSRYASITITTIHDRSVYFKWADEHEATYSEEGFVNWLKEYKMVLIGKPNNFTDLYNKLTS